MSAIEAATEITKIWMAQQSGRSVSLLSRELKEIFRAAAEVYTEVLNK